MTNVKSCGYSLMIVWENRFLFHPALFFGRKLWPHFELNSVCMQNANVKKAISKIINLIIIMEVNWF